MSKCIRSTDLLLIPGMMCDEMQWAHQKEALSGQCQIHPCAMIGFKSIQEIAESILEKAPATFALAGLSMGAIVAFEIWRQAPERVERMALLDTNFRADTEEKKAVRNRQIKEVFSGALAEVLRNELKPNYLAEIHCNNTELLQEVLDMGLRLGKEVFLDQSIALRDRPDSRSTLGSINRPVVIICGKEDQLCPPSLHQELAAAIPDSELYLIDDCGHLSTMEQPEAVNKILLGWLQK